MTQGGSAMKGVRPVDQIDALRRENAKLQAQTRIRTLDEMEPLERAHWCEGFALKLAQMAEEELRNLIKSQAFYEDMIGKFKADAAQHRVEAEQQSIARDSERGEGKA